MEDDLVRRFVPLWLQGLLKHTLAFHGSGTRQLSHLAIATAQRAAQRMAYRRRRNVLKMDTWLEEALSFSGSGMGF